MRMREVLVLLGVLVMGGEANYPVFDVNTQMRLLLVPSDARIGSVIYRIRATDADKDYPLHFDATDYGSYVVRLDNLACNKSSSYCEANVYLERSLGAGQVFKFRVTVRDTRGDTTTLPATLHVTRANTNFDFVFPHVPGVITVPENISVGTELEYVVVRKNPRSLRPATLELWGSDNFKFEQSAKKDSTTGVIKLVKPLDYEQKTMYKLNVFATGMYVDLETDSRNIAGFPLVVVVTDVQDTPPVWDHIEPITKISPNMSKGDVVLRVTARDGDKGAPRPVRYGLVSENNPFTVFFSVDQDSGEIRLARSLNELKSISKHKEPILLTVIAEETVLGSLQAPVSSTATVALILEQTGNTPPFFLNNDYTAYIDENSYQGTPIVFSEPYIAEVKDNDLGKEGVFSLELVNNNGTFEIAPRVAEREAQFVVSVRDNKLLDYELNQILTFRIMAKEVNPEEKPLSSYADVTVYIRDVNDNPPVFLASNYSAQIPENTTHGFHILTVKATDVDTGEGGIVRYTSILGPNNNSLAVHPESGLISILSNDHGFDREQANYYQLEVEARDMRGRGNAARVPLLIEVLDVNDNAPQFDRTPVEFILGPDGTNFSQKAFIKATDNDAEAPNNIVRYEIIKGNYGGRFLLDAETGELSVNPQVLARQQARGPRESALEMKRATTKATGGSAPSSGRSTPRPTSGARPPRQAPQEVYELVVRAYDMGVPTRWSSCQVRIFPSDTGTRVMRFIVSGSPDRRTVERMLTELTGGRVVIHNIVPYNGQYINSHASTTDLTYGNSNSDKSVVTATVLYNNNAVIDIDKFQTNLSKNKTKPTEGTAVTETILKSESTGVFWILLAILLLLILCILFLLCCCFCAACPFYESWKRKKTPVKDIEHISYISGMKDRENKGTQAEYNISRSKEAWSGDMSSRAWRHNRRNNEQRVILMAPVENMHRRQPSMLLSREMVGSIQSHAQNDLILEDIDGTEYRIVDPARLSMRTGHDRNEETLRRQEYDRRSDRYQVAEERGVYQGRPPTRDQMFIRDGGAEILRLVTRGREEEDEEPMLNQPERPYTKEELKESSGKEAIMRRFIEDQEPGPSGRHEPDEESAEQSAAEYSQSVLDQADQVSLPSRVPDEQTAQPQQEPEEDDLFKRLMNTRESNLTTADVNRLTTIQRDLLLARFLVEEQKRLMNRSVMDDTQSLPGVVAMGTQTDVEAGTQTDRFYFVKRRAKSDNDDSMSEGEETRPNKRFRKTKKTIVIVDPDSVRPRKHKRLCETIKSPIIEETEHIEVVNGFIPTKTSVLRHKANRAKFGLEDDPSRSVPPVKHKEEVYIMKSMSDQDLHSITKHREGVMSSLEKTHVHKINIPYKVHNEEVNYDDQRSKSSMSIHNYAHDDNEVFLNQSLNEELLSANTNSQSQHRYLNDTVASLSKKSPVRRPNYKDTSGQSRYMDWYKNNKDNKDKKKIVKEKAKPVRIVPKRPSIKKSDYELIKREFMKNGRVPAFRVQPDEYLTNDSAISPLELDTELDSLQTQKVEDHDSGIAMPFASLPPAITAVTLSRDGRQEEEKEPPREELLPPEPVPTVT